MKMIQNEYQNKFSNSKGLIEYLIVILNLEEQQNDSEITDLKLLEKEFGEDFEEASLHQLIENMQKIIILINETMKKTNEVSFNQQYQKFELEKYEHFLKQFKILLETNNNKKLIVVNLEKIINQLQIIVQILNKALKQNFEIFQILIIEELGKLREIINQQNYILLKYQENKIQQNNQKNYINSINIILKILQIQQILIKEQKNYLVLFLQEIVDFSSYINLIQSYNVEKQKDITKFFNLSYQKQINNFIELQYTIRNLKQDIQENESSLNYLERILIDLQQDITQIKKDGGKPNIYDLLNKQKVKIQNQLEEKSYKLQELFIEQEFYVLQIYNINQLDGLTQEIDGESNQQLLLSDFWIQKLKHNKKNEEWKIKEGLVFAIIQISSNCFTDTIISFCQKALIQIWAKEKDQRIRNLLKNKRIISLQMQLLQKDWKTQHDRIADEMQNMLNKIDDLQEQISHEINHNKRDQQLQKLDQTTQQLDEYIENISDMGQQLKLITDFLNYIRKGLTRFERKINIMKEQLNSMGNDIKFLRGKSVDQLFEIRKWKVLKEAAQKNIKSIYIPLKTQEKGQLNPSSLINLEQFDDKVGEVNEFLLDEKETVLLIHGVAGSGKSTTAKKLEEFIWKLHDNNIKISNQILIPVYISLPFLKNPVFQAVEETLHQDEYGFDNLQLKECKEMLEKKEFRFLFIMDSYDEMKLENIKKIYILLTNLIKIGQILWSEILTTSNYKEWFVPEDKKQIKEVQLLKFDEMQKKEYLTKFTLLSIKVLVFEIYEWQTQMKYQSSIDFQNFEKSWEKLHAEVLKQFISNVNSESLLNQKQIENIFLFLKNDNHIALKSIEAIRSLGFKLQKLWSVRKYENMIKMINLDKLIQTPYMMEIIVSVLPLMMVKKTEIINLKQNFIKNFSKMYRELLKSEYLIKMYANHNQNQEASRLEMQFIEKYDYIQTAIEIWNKMEENQIPNQFQISQEINELNIKLIKIFQHNYKNILGIKDEIIQKVQINFERLIELICDALKEQNLTSYDFYDEFIKQYHLKQIEKQRNLGKSINTDRFLYDLYKYSIKLAKQMSIKEVTQVQYKQQGLLYKVENEEEKWLNEFFNDDGQDGSYKIDIRSCSLIQQKGANFQFVHKSIQQFLISADLYELLVLSKDLDVKIFSKLIKIFIYEKVIDCLGFLQNDVNQNHYKFCIQLDNLSLYDKQQKLNIIENNIKNITNIVRMLKQHDLNLINYSAEIYVETRKQLIQQIYQEKNIIEFLKFIVHLTAFDQSFIQSGSNFLNLLVEMKVDLTNLCFRNIKIKNTSLIGASFVKCDLSESQFENVKINGINLNGAQLFNCKWKNLQMNELHKLEGHSSDVNSVCFSPDGTMLASGSAEKSIHLWDVKTGKKISKLEGHSHWVNSVCFSPNGTLLASGSWDNTIRLWDQNLNLKNKRSIYNQFVSVQMAIHQHLEVQIILLTGQEKSKLVGHNDSVFSISFSPDGTKLASGSADKSIRLWDLKTGKEQQKLEGHNESINSECFSPDGTTLAYSCRDCTIHLWDIKAQVEKYKLEGHNSYVLSVCFSSDGIKLASGSWDNTIRLWDVNTGQENSKLEGQSDGIYSVCFSPDGTILAAGSADKSIRLWDVKTKQEKLQLEGHSENVNSVSFSPDGTILASGSSDYIICLWDLRKGQKQSSLEGHSDSVISVSFSSDGIILASGSRDNTVQLWDIRRLQEKFKLEGHNNFVYSVCFSPDGNTLASGSWNNTIRLWDVKKGQRKLQLKGHIKQVQSLCFSPDGTILASGGWDNAIRLWNVKTGEEKFKLDGHVNQVLSVCFSPDGFTLASRSADKSIRIWDIKDALSNQISIHSNQDILIQNSDYQDPLGIISNILTIVLISQQGLLEAQGTQIQKGSFTNHLGMDMRIHFKKKGAHLLEHLLESEQNAVQI
ncbi:unnamed protein product [Paramecium pentaurelia]|uniref:NACHT domain-containing protein n=1 Tax=Paramecium pentaurelia TaxID=43138 RepID=A0A8S1XSL0_9CILI|nr:unnamed protein product [Paramecium pentaurelia]